MMTLVLGTLVLALRGVATVLVLTTLVGGLPRIVQAGLALFVGLWSSVLASAFVASIAVDDGLLLVAARELVVGATMGLVAAMPLLAAQIAGRLVDLVAAGNNRPTGAYRALFGILAAAVFVGIDGHVIVMTSLVESFRDVPAIVTTQPRVIDAIGSLIANGVRLAMPWLVTAAVVEIAVGVGMRLAGRAGAGVPSTAAVPAALGMMTAALVGTLAVTFAQLVVR